MRSHSFHGFSPAKVPVNEYEIQAFLICFVYNALKTTIFCPLGVSATWNHAETSRAETPGGQLIVV